MAEATERVLIATPTRVGRVVAAPFQLRTLADDFLRVRMYWSESGVGFVNIRFTWRTLTDAGEVLTSSEEFSGNATRTTFAALYPLREGFLLSLSAQLTNVVMEPGALWVQAYVTRQSGTPEMILTPLLQGYPTFRQALVWPGSTFEVQTPTPSYPATYEVASFPAGTDAIVTVPNGVDQQLVSVSAVLTTSATVGARRVPLVLGANPTFNRFTWVWRSPNDQTAGQVRRYSFGLGTPHDYGFQIQEMTDALPDDLWMISTLQWGFPGSVLAGDQWTDLRYQVNERMQFLF